MIKLDPFCVMLQHSDLHVKQIVLLLVSHVLVCLFIARQR